ncbi:MAG: M3 family oligoendopeptidase [Pseudomonadota bacterium]
MSLCLVVHSLSIGVNDYPNGCKSEAHVRDRASATMHALRPHIRLLEKGCIMFKTLPPNAAGILHWSWPDFEPYYNRLISISVDSGSVTEFLADWSRLSELVSESYSRLMVATTRNTADKEAEQRYFTFLDEIYPKSEEAEQRLKMKLLDCGIVPPGFEIPYIRMRTESELFREENLPLVALEQKMCTEYDKIMGAQTVQWNGSEITIQQLRPAYQDPDRSLRERAWRSAAERQIRDYGAIGDLWGRFLDLRLKMAANAGFDDYRSFRWKDLNRFDYTPQDCMRFHEAIEKAVVPVAARLCEKRRELLGVESLRPWDMNVDPLGRPPLKPFSEAADLKAQTSRLFHSLDPQLGAYFDIMVVEDLLDLDNRKNKAPGGYCCSFAAVKRPFIFMNAVGMHDDVQTLLHESGHAFHGFESGCLPYIQQRHVGMEFSEVASMAMELLAGPYLLKEHGGFYDPVDADRAVTEHLEQNILFWPYMAVVDAFQHWVYENPAEARKPAACDRQWEKTWNRFIPWIDWSGLEEDLRTGWQRKLHIHTVPFYYVEYGLALLGAVQVWGNAMKDRAGALAMYRQGLSLGGTKPVPDLFAAAGAKFAFDAETLGTAVSLMEGAIDGEGVKEE